MRLQRFLDALSRVQQRHALLLFLMLGAALFAAEGLRRPAQMLEPPASTDAGAAAQWLEEEVLYREALARGLGEGDLMVRRRLVQKMRLLLETGVDVAEPSASELSAWIAARPGRYAGLKRMSLEHIFLSHSRRGMRLQEDAALLAVQLRGAGVIDARALSDPHPGAGRQERLDAAGLDRLFGSALAEQIKGIAPGGWQGPLPSALGLHFLRIRSRQEHSADDPAVRERAHRDYLLERRRELTQVALTRLKSGYGLRGDPP